MSGLIKYYPSDHLLTACKECESEEDFSRALELKTTLEEVTKMMNGAGLAANQVGENLKVALVNPKADPEYSGKEDMFLIINPVILEQSEEVEMDEGCLSLPGAQAKVKRFNKVKVKFLDENRADQEQEFEGTLAQIFQHEIDHLNGKLYIDHFGPMKRQVIINKVKKFLSNPMANIKRIAGSRL